MADFKHNAISMAQTSRDPTPFVAMDLVYSPETDSLFFYDTERRRVIGVEDIKTFAHRLDVIDSDLNEWRFSPLTLKAYKEHLQRVYKKPFKSKAGMKRAFFETRKKWSNFP